MSKSSIRFNAIEIKLDRNGEYGAIAVGQYAQERTARLRRVSKTE
jgi:hypothetical protein